MRGQIGVEHIVILGVTLIILLPGIYLFYDNIKTTDEKIEIQRMVSFGNSVIDNTQTLNALGSLSKRTIYADLPESFINATIIGNQTILINYESSQGISQLVFVSAVDLSGPSVGNTLSDLKPGRTKLSMQNYAGDVCLTFDGGICSPSCGNKIIEPNLGERCDGNNLANFDCRDFGYNSGSLLCRSDCSDFELGFCSDCLTYGPYCLDINYDSVTDESDYVEPLYYMNSEASVEFLPFSNNYCGLPGTYYLIGGAGLKINYPNSFDRGLYLLSVTAVGQDDPAYSQQDNSIQCEGTVYDFQDNNAPNQELLAECYFDGSNPDIRVVTYNVGEGTRIKYRYEETLAVKICGSECHHVFDSGYECLSLNHGSMPNHINSDFVTIKNVGGGSEGNFREWDALGLPAGYEDSCDYIYYFDLAEGHNPSWKIENFTGMLEPGNEAGTYEMFFNIIWDNSPDQTQFEISCGNGPTKTIIKPSHIENDALKMVTEHDIYCEFSGNNDRIRLRNPTNSPGMVAFERFKFRRACS